MDIPRVSDLSHKKKKLLRLIMDCGEETADQKINPRSDTASEPPLSHVQERMWFLSQLATPYPNNLPSAVRLKGTLDIPALQQAFNIIIHRHEALRTTFPVISGTPVQRIAKEVSLPIPVKDLAHLPDGDREAAFYQAAKAEINRSFDLAAESPIRIRLYRLAEDDHLLLLIAHHIIWDGWSIGIFTGELALFYEAFSKGETPKLPRPALQYADFAVWQREHLSGSRLDNLVRFWKETLGEAPDLDLPLDHPRPDTQTFKGAMAPVFISKEMTEELSGLSRSHDATLFMTLLAAFNILLFKYSDTETIVVGSPTANRRKKEIENIIGCFANIFVLSTDVSGNPGFDELIARTRETVLAAQAHQDMPFEMMVEHLNVRHDPRKNPIFQTMFGLHTTSLNELELPGLTLSPVPMDSDTTHFDLGLHLWQQKGTLSGYISYRTDIFEESTITGMRTHFQRILDAVVENDNQRISDISLLTETERSDLSKKGPAPLTEENIYRRFAKTAAAHPHATAVIYPDKNTGETAGLAYADLHRKAQAFSAKLPMLVPGTEIRAAVRLKAGPEFAVAVLGILRAGGTVTLLDPDLPQRTTADLADAFGINFVVLDNGDTGGSLPSCKAGLSMFFSDGLMAEGFEESTPQPKEVPPDHPAFMEGLPENGVTISNERMLRRITTLQSKFSLTIKDTLITVGDTANPALIWETLWPLLTGASLSTVHAGNSSDTADRRIYHMTPGEFTIRSTSDLTGKLLPTDLVLISGGPLPASALENFIKQTRAGVTYMYSPPEASLEAGFMDCRKDAASIRLSSTAGLRLLDRYLTPVPPSVPGDIYMDARGLSPLEGNQTFRQIPDPLSPETMLIKTSDRGRMKPDHTLTLLPASTGHFWKEGRRIHTGMVSSALLRHPLMADCHVAGNHDALTAYAVTRGPIPQIRKHLSAYLPPAMMPDRVLTLNQIPLTPSGQPDIAALMRLDNTSDTEAARWEAAIAAIPEVDKVKVFRQEVPVPRRQIHIADILPETGNTDAECIQPLEDAAKQPEELPPAFSDGGPLDIPEDAPLTLGQALVKTAATRGHLGIIVVQDTEKEQVKEIFISYADLLEAGERILTGLQSKGLGPGDRVILQLADMTAYFKSFWACMLGGIIPVTIAVDTGYAEKSGVVKKLWNSWKLLECPPIIAEADTASALAGVPDLFRDEDDTQTPLSIFSYERLAASDRKPKIHQGRSEDVAFHQLTSGSTGIPKCVQITNSGAIHYIYGAVSFGNTDKDITLNWLPMDHVVPLLTCHLKDVYLGNQQIQVHPRLVLANPLIWLDLLDKHRCTYTWAPNFGFKLLTDALNEVPDRTWDITPLKFLLTGGEQITLPVIADIHRQLTGFGMDPDAMRSGYGMAEIGTVAVNPNVLKPERSADRFLKSSLNGVLEETDIEGESSVVFINLGPARAGVQFRIVDDDNRQLPEKTIGNLQVRGGIVTPGYLNNDEVNREAFAGDGWFNTGDQAFIRNNILTITGRVKETIIICGANYYCYEIEDIVNDIPGVEPTFSAAVAVDNPKMGSEGLAVFFVPKAWADSESTEKEIDIPLIRSVRNKVGKELGISPEFVIPMAKKAFPKTTSGKLQRTDLKKGLDRGHFSGVIKQIELAGESRNTLPDWFFEKIWIRKAAACHPAEGRGACLVFTGDVPLYNAITTKQPGQYIRIEPGIAYEKRSGNHYTLRPAVAEDYEKLLGDLKRDGINFRSILHLWAMAPQISEIDPAGINTAMDTGVRSLLGLYRAVSSLTAANRPHAWLTVGSGLLDVRPDDPLALEHAAIPGLINVLDQELPGIHCRLVDISADKADATASLILKEASAHGDRITAHRGNNRFIPKLSGIKFAPKADTVIQPGSLILISGGLGGVGIEIARHLLVQYNARLVLVGQTPLPDETTPDEDAATATDEAALASTRTPAQRLAALKDLRRLGGDVIYEVADVGNTEQMNAVRDRAVDRFGEEFSGVIHLAGAFPTRMLAEETIDTFDRTLYPKVNGAMVLEGLLPKDGFFITFSSLFTFFGGLGVGAYTAANGFLEGFCHHLRRTGRPESYCFGWTVWNDTGMSRGFQLKEQSKANGYHQIPPQKGILSLMAGLHSRHHSPMIGLNPAKPAIEAAILHKEARLTRVLTAAYTTHDGEPCDGRFRMLSIGCGATHLTEMPLDKNGDIDLRALERTGGSRGASGRGHTAPRTSYEKTIEAIWREVLEVEDFGIHETFFELGGQSILLVKTQTKLQQMFNRDISIVELLRYPTISTLAKYLEEGKKRQSFDGVKARAEKLKQKRTQRTRPKSRRPARPVRRTTRRGK